MSEKFPSQIADKFVVRLPDGLREQIKEAAAANGRSMNSEIVARLDGSAANLRDLLAGQIACGMAAFSGTAGASYGPDEIAGRSYQVADAMLVAREPQP